MNNEFASKVVLITGGGSGIGRATAMLFAAHGAHVVVSDVNEKGGNDTVTQITQAKGKASFIKADVSKPEEVEKMMQTIASEHGRLDVAFNNAGIGGESNPVANLSLDGWHKVIAINLNSVFYCMKYELGIMEPQGSGVIINTASILGQVAFAGSSAYVAAKHGVVGLTKNAAVEYAKRGIRVVSVGPAFIVTPLLEAGGLDEEAQKQLIPLHPIGRLGKAQEVAELILWLGSDKASFVTGAYYPVDGGYLSV